MNGSMVGADADSLDAAANELKAAADQLELSARTLSSSLGSLSWLGRVAVGFSDIWNSIHNPGMARTAGFLHDNAERLHRQAAQQRAASDGSGGASHWAGGSLIVAPVTVPVGATPAAVAAWWAGLTPEQRAALIASSPEVIGNLNGVPFVDRYSANAIYMQQLLDAELSPDGPMHKLLTQFTVDNNGRIDPTRHFVAFDPSGDGRAAEVFGDITTATNVAVIVPGLNSTMENFGGVSGNARALQQNAGSDTAVIAWLGYDAPNLGLHDISTGVATDEMARAGAAELAGFVGALRQQSTGDIALIGHSYGSLVVGEALKAGVQVETAVFIGSPGVGVNSVHDFPPGAADRYFAGEIPGDPVASLERFGESPTDPDFGAQVFDAGPGGYAFNRHSQYFDAGRGMDSMVSIVTGGQPPGAHAAPIDYVLEPLDDAGNAVGGAVDWVQSHVHVPVVGNVVNGVIDGAQSVARGAGNLAETVVETVVDAGTDAVRDAGNWASDQAHKTLDALTFWN